MKPPRPLLHAARKAAGLLFFPGLAVVIWGELAAPMSPLMGLFEETSDKALHFIAYFWLSALAAGALQERRRALWSAFGLVLLGAFLEVLQRYMGRDASVFDELANIAGVTIGGLSMRILVEALRRRWT